MPLAKLELTISVYYSDTRSITTLDSKDPVPSRYPNYPAHRVQLYNFPNKDYQTILCCIKQLVVCIWPRFIDMRIVEYQDSWLRPKVKPFEGFDLSWKIYFVHCNFLYLSTFHRYENRRVSRFLVQNKREAIRRFRIELDNLLCSL